MDFNLPYKYKPRDYQLPLLADMDRGINRGFCVWHRRAGKDKTGLNYMINRMGKRIGSYYYYFPTMALGRKILWDGCDKTGFRFLDHFPKKLIDGRPNQQEMKIRLRNGSLFQIIGTDRLDVVGPNPVGCIFSEYAQQNPKGWDYIRPILAENEGWAIFFTTPRGKNHAYRSFRDAQKQPDLWHTSILTVDDTKAIDLAAIEAERKSGMSEELIQQEFYCSFDIGVEGSVYGRLMTKAYDDGRICSVPFDNAALVHTAWDFGISDKTVIWWFQLIGKEIHLLDYYEDFGKEIAFYVQVIRQHQTESGYMYGNHYAPFDANQRSLQTGKSLAEKAKGLGLVFKVLEQEKNILTGIAQVRNLLHRCWFDVNKCQDGINALENYHYEFSDKYQAFSSAPAHDWASHGADGFRYLTAAVTKQVDMASYGLSLSEYRALKHKYARVS